MAPESTRSSSSTASRRLRGLLRRTLRVVRPISDTLAALGAAGQARRIAWTRSTVAQRTTPPLICRGARRHRCLPPAGRPRLGRPPSPRRRLRPPRHPLGLVHGPPLPAGAPEAAVLRSVDDGGGHYRLRPARSRPGPAQRPHPPIHVGGAGEKRTLPLVARHADVWNCPTYALAELPRKLAVLRRECERIGRDPATLRVTEEAVLALAPTRARVDEARATAERRFGGPGWGFAAGGYCGTPDGGVARIRARARLGLQGGVFFLHDRAEPETLRLLADEVVPAARDL